MPLKFYSSENMKIINYLYAYIANGGTPNVMVSDVGNGTSDWVQIVDKAVCISHCTNILEKGMNPIPPPLAMSK